MSITIELTSPTVEANSSGVGMAAHLYGAAIICTDWRSNVCLGRGYGDTAEAAINRAKKESRETIANLLKAVVEAPDLEGYKKNIGLEE